MNLLRTLSAVSALTLLSRISGLMRESIKAVGFGAGLQMDAFEAAFRLPNILRRMFAEGAFSQAFVPILAEYKRSRGEDATRDLVGKVGSLLAVTLLGMSVFGVVAAPWLVYAAGRQLRAHAGQGRADHGADPHHVSLRAFRVAGVAGRRGDERLPAVRHSRVHSGPAQCRDHRGRRFRRAARRPADSGAGDRRGRRRRRAAGLSAAASGEAGHASQVQARLARRGRAARARARWVPRCSACRRRRLRR